ncbi:hypothetical protein BDW74DRAFT_182485 [Aspergillus multicolor]|uniref:uncharacterized protein n=1 Tax=Aspergillus multicolor TaxID=41759 RepID=UPI003CCE29B1
MNKNVMYTTLKMALFVASLPLQLPTAAASNLDTTTQIPGYAMAEVAWDVAISPDGPHVTLNGTIQEVYRQLVEINPEYSMTLGLETEAEDENDDDDEPEDVDPDADATTPAPTPSATLTKRQTIKEYFCFGRWEGCSRKRIRKSINKLRGVQGTPSLPAGPAVCGRVSCSKKAAIFLCNDNRGTHNLASWNIVADAASYIESRCVKGGNTAGQVFYRSNWNVVVRKDKC